MKNKIKIIIIIMTVLFFSNICFGQLLLSPKSISLANSFATQSRGADVIGWNPANLGFDNNPKFSMNFGFLPFVPFPSLSLGNNSINFHNWNVDILSGKELTEKDKKNILGYIENSGFNISPQMQLDLLNISFGRWALGLGVEIFGEQNIPKSLFNFMFNGNEFDVPIDISGADIEMQSIGKLSLYHGREINIPQINDYVKTLNIGFGINYFFGGIYADIKQMDARIISQKDGFLIDGHAIAKVAAGGSGFGLDFGVASQINDKMYANISLNNIFSKINWGNMDLDVIDGESTQKIEYSFSMELGSSEFLDDDIDSLFDKGVERDTSYAAGKFQSTYPGNLTIGFQYNMLDNLEFYGNLRKYFINDFGFSNSFIISGALNYSPINWLPLRAGIAIGGNEKFKWGIGTGLDFKRYEMNIGFSQYQGVFNWAKGFSFSFSQTIKF